METISIQSKDIDMDYIYSIDIPFEKAVEILNSSIEDKIVWGTNGAYALVGEDTITISSRVSGGTSAMSKKDVLSQIQRQVNENA
ncbi:hypothetical protein C4G85_RS22350 [Vibrio parahaemolyticus]|nr:hypothetical protein [Vibrio parahaemolyticus]